MPACLTFFLPVSPSVWKYSAFIGRIFIKYYIAVFFENLASILMFHQSLTRITGALLGDKYTFVIISS